MRKSYRHVPTTEQLEGHYPYLYNAQGDVRAILDSNFEAVVFYDYDSWGQPLSTTGELAETLGSLNPFRYRGYVYDEETGLYYLNSRYYDPVVGRFINADSVCYLGVGGILSFNLFSYCESDPVNGYDPYGTFDLNDLIGKIKNIMKGIGGKIGGSFGGKLGGGTVSGGSSNASNYGSGAKGVGNPVKVEGRGSTGRTSPNTLNEQMTMHQVKSNPLDGATKLPFEMKDIRWLATEGWIKMQVKIKNADGMTTVIHFVYNIITGAFDDFKFK